MSGYPSVLFKLSCARVEGFTHTHAYRPGSRQERLLAYAVPPAATPTQQRDALLRAFDLAESDNRTVVLPSALYDGRQYSFCRLFDAKLSEAQQGLAGSSSAQGICTHLLNKPPSSLSVDVVS